MLVSVFDFAFGEAVKSELQLFTWIVNDKKPLLFGVITTDDDST